MVSTRQAGHTSITMVLMNICGALHRTLLNFISFGSYFGSSLPDEETSKRRLHDLSKSLTWEAMKPGLDPGLFHSATLEKQAEASRTLQSFLIL